MIVKSTPPEPPRAIFDGIASIEDVATLLATSKKQLHYLLYARSEKARYTTFKIRKRRGGTRTIKAPRGEIKAIQRRLADFLQDNSTVRQPAHGFVRGRSIATNAALHAQHKTILNIDLRDFFPTINFGRVRGLFMAPSFGAKAPAATILAQICCYEGSLPQGAPTSPAVSNLICFRMDAQLQGLAKRCGCVYTRYADDLTFSRRKGAFPSELATEDVEGETVIGKELRAIVESNGFQIHPEKVHLHRNTCRQTVTGLVVNSRVNVSRNFIRQIRAILCDWKARGLEAAQERHHKDFYRHPDRLGKMPPLPRILEGKLNFLRMVRGVDDQLRKNLQSRLTKLWPEYHKIMEKENRQLDMRDLFISHASEDKAGFVRPLVDALIAEGVSVWYDEFELTIGDDLLVKINEGLTRSRYGVVVLSPNFFDVKKTWPDREVGALFAQEDADKRPRVLPIWHNVKQSDVAAKNPILAGKIAWKSTDFSPAQIAEKFREFMKTRRR